MEPHILYTIAAMALASVTIYYIHRRERNRKLNVPGIPVVTGPRFGDYRRALKEAITKYPEQPFMVSFFDPTIIVPYHCVDELKNLPDSQLSLNGNQFTRFAGSYTESVHVSQEMAQSIKFDLPREIDAIFPTIQQEIQQSVDEVLPLTDDWAPIDVERALAQVAGHVIGRLIVGAPFNRDQPWAKASVDHALGVVMFSFWLRQFPKLLRPVVAPFIPYKRQLDKSKEGIKHTVQSLVKHWSTENSGEKPLQPSESGRLVQWLLKRYAAGGKSQTCLPDIVRDHNTICFAAIHGPRFLLENALIDLAAHPRYVKRLREEIDRELANAPFAEWTQETVSRLEFVDAFCKESARLNPMGVVAWLRQTHQPITLSTGHFIPPDTLIAGMNPLFNPNAFPEIEEPSSFLPERWMKDRSGPSQDESFRFGSATLDSLMFSVGRHSCPGRFLGANIVKAVLAYTVARWDVRLGGGRKGRPDNVYMDFQILPPVPPMGDLFLEIRARSEP